MILNLNRIFNPQSIAIIGASNEVNSVGFGLTKNALEGSSQRKIFVINPFHDKVLGLKCKPSVLSIKDRVDLAIVAVPTKIIESVIEECCQKKVGGIIVISAGFAEVGEDGKYLQEKISNIAKKAKIPLMGPNCLGIIRPSKKLNASFAPATPKSGGVAFVSQSGALIDSVIDGAVNNNYGFSSLISYGNEADIDICDFLLWLKKDKETKAIAIYLEGLKDGKKFMKVAKEVSKQKPIVIIKAGKTEEGRKAVSTHTASLAGSYKVYSAAFAQSGVIEVDIVEDLLGVAKVLSENKKCKNGVGIITNGGGAGVLMTDYCTQLGINIPDLDKKTIAKLQNLSSKHSIITRKNPLDLLGDAQPERYAMALEALLSQKNIHSIVVIQTLQIMTEVEKNAKIIIEKRNKYKDKPILTAFLGGSLSKKGIELLEKNNISNFSELKRASVALKVLIK
ncbi:MAG: CoA-binding protein [Patescibacteria group bacterium]